MDNTFPSFLEIKNYIINNQRATICEIRDKFSQGGDMIVSINKPNCKKKQQILAYDINPSFFTYLQEFIKEDYVLCESDMKACLISDPTIYIGPGEFIPIVLSIKSTPT